MSIDGYYEGDDGNVHSIWKYLHPAYYDDISFHQFNVKRLQSSGTILFGRKTYSGFPEHWKSVLEDEKASEIDLELAKLIVPMDKVVVSSSLQDGDLDPDDHTTIISPVDLDTKIMELKKQPGNDILVFGSRQLWQDLLNRGLVDELHLTVAPVIAGSGTPLFDRQPVVSLLKINTEIHQGNVIISYAFEEPSKQDN